MLAKTDYPSLSTRLLFDEYTTFHLRALPVHHFGTQIVDVVPSPCGHSMHCAEESWISLPKP